MDLAWGLLVFAFTRIRSSESCNVCKHVIPIVQIAIVINMMMMIIVIETKIAFCGYEQKFHNNIMVVCGERGQLLLHAVEA